MNEVDRAEERRQATERLAEVLAGSTGTAEHPSRMATATATATGELKWLRLHPHALSAGPRAVGQLVVETARLATDAAVQRGYNELAKSLGDSMAIAIEGFAGPPPFRAASEAPSARPFAPTPRPGRGPRPPVDDDDDAYFADPFGTGDFRR